MSTEANRGYEAETVSAYRLTLRQQRILLYAAQGMSYLEIACQLELSIHTVNAHLESIRKALGARNTTHAVYIAMQRGLL